MSLCDVCLSPGACCKMMAIRGGPDMVFDPAYPMSRERAEHVAMANGLPFIPGTQLKDGTWLYSCTQLGPDGRCKIYEDRPELCRSYKPGQDSLCVHFWEIEPNREEARL